MVLELMIWIEANTRENELYSWHRIFLSGLVFPPSDLAIPTSRLSRVYHALNHTRDQPSQSSKAIKTTYLPFLYPSIDFVSINTSFSTRVSIHEIICPRQCTPTQTCQLRLMPLPPSSKAISSHFVWGLCSSVSLLDPCNPVSATPA